MYKIGDEIQGAPVSAEEHLAYQIAVACNLSRAIPFPIELEPHRLGDFYPGKRNASVAAFGGGASVHQFHSTFCAQLVSLSQIRREGV